MAANKKVRFGPIALSSSPTTNILNPPTLTGGVVTGTTNTNTYFLLRHIRIVNKTSSIVSVSMWIGTSSGNVAGTEFDFGASSVQPNSYVDWYGELRLDVGDFLVGGAGAGSSLTFQAEGEIGIA